MQKIIVVVCLAAWIAGCSYGKERVELMLDNPPEILEDSLYTETQTRMEELESRYLNGEISYAQYLEKKTELENRYKQQADHRFGIIEGNQ